VDTLDPFNDRDLSKGLDENDRSKIIQMCDAINAATTGAISAYRRPVEREQQPLQDFPSDAQIRAWRWWYMEGYWGGRSYFEFVMNDAGDLLDVTGEGPPTVLRWADGKESHLMQDYHYPCWGRAKAPSDDSDQQPSESSVARHQQG
jgi:hypothetical protein